MKLWTKSNACDLLALFAGALLPASFAPFGCVWLAPPVLVIFLFLLQKQTLTRARLRSFLFGLGLFGTGASWVYVSIHDFAYTTVPFAALLTFSFVAIMAAVFALPLCLWTQLLYCERSKHIQQWILLLGFPAIWVLGEWYRSWFMTGFAWLYIGYSQTETWVGGWAPVISVYGIGFWLALMASSVVFALNAKKHLWLPFAVVLCAVGGGKMLDNIDWSYPISDGHQPVVLIQGNVAQDEKWLPEQRQAIRTLYRTMSAPFWKKGQLVVWPEAAIPELYTTEQPFFMALNEEVKNHHGSLILGLPSLHKNDHKPSYMYNSLLGLGDAQGFYHKRRLVPFGEYVPLKEWLADLLDFLKLPMSDFSLGPKEQAALYTGKFHTAGSICYEITYPEMIAKQSKNADFMLTVSNDSWFGRSIGPHLHMQMAQMRARENARELVRATSNGISAFVDYKGRIISHTPQFLATTLSGNVQARHGETPYQRWGDWPVLLLCFALLGFVSLLACRQTTTN